MRKIYNYKTHDWKGYWPRTLSSILFFKPWKQPNEQQDPFEIADSWLKLSVRSDVEIIDMLTFDIARMNKTK